MPQEARTLSIFHGPDEAYWGLRFIRLTSEWVHHVASIVARLGMPVLTMAASLAAAWWAVEHGMEAPRPDLAEINAMAAAARIPLYAGGAMVGTALLLWTSAALVAILPMIGVGTFNVADHLWLDISMKRTPQISSAFVQYNEMPLHSGGFLANVIAALPVFSGPLVHSRVYADPRTAQVIGRWYREDEGSAAPAGSR
jgi:hypothetical protein